MQIRDGVINFVSGTAGGLAGVVAGQPFDTLKVRLQSSTAYKGILDCLRRIRKEESLLGLFKGVSSPLVGVTLSNAFVFSVYGFILSHLDPLEHNSAFNVAVSGAGAGFANSILTSPIELAKINLQSKNSMYSSPREYLTKTYKTRGIRGLFLGYGATVWRETPSYATYFLVYESLLSPDTSPVEILFIGASAGICAWISSYPADVIKTKIQLSNGEYKGMLHCLKSTLKTEGHKGLWRGLNATIFRAIPTNAATFAAYYYVKDVLSKQI